MAGRGPLPGRVRRRVGNDSRTANGRGKRLQHALERACVEGGGSLEGIAFRPDVFFDKESIPQLVGDEADEIDLDDVYESEEPDDPDDDPDKRSLWDEFLDWLWGNSEGNWKQRMDAAIPISSRSLLTKRPRRSPGST